VRARGKKKSGRKPKLDSNNRLLVTLIYYRHKTPYKMMELMFAVADSTLDDTVAATEKLIHAHVTPLFFVFQRKEDVVQNIPKAYADKHSGVYLSIDGTVLPTKAPGDFLLQKLTYSSYKNCNGYIVLIGEYSCEGLG
jgi:hypothetical protein